MKPTPLCFLCLLFAGLHSLCSGWRHVVFAFVWFFLCCVLAEIANREVLRRREESLGSILGKLPGKKITKDESLTSFPG